MNTQPTPSPGAVRAAEAIAEECCIMRPDPDGINYIAAIIARENRAEVEALTMSRDSAMKAGMELSATLYAKRQEVAGLVAALRDLRKMIPTAHCEDFHHAKKDRHELGQDCPPLKRWESRIGRVDALLARYPQQKE